MSRSSIPIGLRRTVFERDEGRCRYCLLPQVGQGATFHIDHIVPESKGGATELDNLALQCPYCSLHKSDQTEGTSDESKDRVRLFHPLLDEWEEHFQLQRDARIVGLTDIGRVTIEALKMNDAIPRLARMFAMAVGLLAANPA